MFPPPFRPSLGAFAVAGVLFLSANGTVIRAAEPLAAVPAAATATAPAERMGRVPTGFFPMDPSPKCDILTNFGDPRSGGRRHEGVDILATLGQAVYAVADGTLTYQARVGDGTSGSALSGNLWRLTAPDGTYYVYAHLSGFAPGLERGSVVQRGQVIGYVGDTGNPGPGNYHLHFEIHPGGGAAVDPMPLLDVPATCRVF